MRAEVRDMGRGGRKVETKGRIWAMETNSEEAVELTCYQIPATYHASSSDKALVKQGRHVRSVTTSPA